MKEVRYPIEFTKCPSCGSMDRLIGNEVEAAIARGEVEPGDKVAILQTQTIIFSRSRLPKMVGIGASRVAVEAFFDVCLSCGTIYCVWANRVKALIGSSLPGPRDGGPPIPFMGQG